MGFKVKDKSKAPQKQLTFSIKKEKLYLNVIINIREKKGAVFFVQKIFI